MTHPTTWHHTPGKRNSSVCTTRGLYPHQLKSYDSLWPRPSWLSEPSIPTFNKTVLLASNLSECMENKTDSNNLLIGNDRDFLARFSSYTKILRIVAWIKRFLHNFHSVVKLTGSL